MAMHASGCGHWIWPMSMNESPCIPPGTFAGTAKVTRCQVRPASLVIATTEDPALYVLPIRYAIRSLPAA
jgi:hypothetical protein